MERLAAVVTALLLLPGVAHAQAPSSIYQPYGFQLPFLSAGEYVVSARYSQFSSEANAQITPMTAYTKSLVEDRMMRVQGVVALSRYVLLEAGMFYTPGQTTGDFESIGQVAEIRESAHVAPDVTVVVRPLRYLEVFGRMGYESSKQDQVNSFGSFITLSDIKTLTRTFDVGVSYYGKF